MGLDFEGLAKLYQSADQYSNDPRLSDIKDNAQKYTLPDYNCLKDWNKRREELKRRILVSAGLFPFPEKHGLQPVVTKSHKFDGFTVENLYFESHPGLFVTGNLYIPDSPVEKLPAILNPHGHWENGRLESSGTSDIPTRCANFAKLGFIAFSYDMLGYCDSLQLNHCAIDPENELWGVNLFGLQLWNSLRSVDFLSSHPLVDPERIGCTGASGGATQTFFLSAIDDRVKVTIPVNMVSNTFQGGCCCENAPYLRIGAGNVEYAALTAPRPMLLVGCSGDWTRNLKTVEYPDIQRIYGLYNAKDKVEMYFEDAEHNYNKNAREQSYRWFSRHLAGKDVSWRETEFLADRKLLQVFPLGRLPDGIISGTGLLKNLTEQRTKAAKDYINSLSSQGKQEALAVWIMMTGVNCSSEIVVQKVASTDFDANIDTFEIVGSNAEGSYVSGPAITNLNAVHYLVGTKEAGERIPTVAIANSPVARENSKALLMLHPDGKEAWLQEPDRLLSCMETYDSLILPDLFLTGESHSPLTAAIRNSKASQHNEVNNENYFTTYNHTNTALRIQDLVTVFRAVKTMGYKEINIIARGDAGLWLLAAAPFLDGVGCMETDCQLPESDEEYIQRFYLPGFRALGGFEFCKMLVNY